MPDLLAFQRGVAAALLDPARGHPLAGQPGLAVYRNNSAGAVIDALRAAYPTVAMLVGEARFEQLALDFFARHPPASPVLADYGEGFADRLQDQPWIRELPYLPDVARLDRLRVEALFAADAPVLDAGALNGLAPEDWMTLRLKLHPTARFAWLSTPAMSIWLAHQDGEPREEVAPLWQAEGALFTRVGGGAVAAACIDRPEHRLLFGLRLGEAVGQAALTVAAIYPQADISRLFAKIIGSGALLALERNG